MAAVEIFKNPAVRHKLLVSMEILMPPLVHFLNLSVVEILIHGRIFYGCLSNFASVLFILSLAMIFQKFRKQILPSATSVLQRFFFLVNLKSS